MDQDQTSEEGTLIGPRWFSERAKVMLTCPALENDSAAAAVPHPPGCRWEELRASVATRRPRRRGEALLLRHLLLAEPRQVGSHRRLVQRAQVPRAASARAPQGVKGCRAPRDLPKLVGRRVSSPASRCLSAGQVSAQLVVLLSGFSYSVLESPYLEWIFLFTNQLLICFPCRVCSTWSWGLVLFFFWEYLVSCKFFFCDFFFSMYTFCF